MVVSVAMETGLVPQVAMVMMVVLVAMAVLIQLVAMVAQEAADWLPCHTELVYC